MQFIIKLRSTFRLSFLFLFALQSSPTGIKLIIQATGAFLTLYTTQA